MATQLTGLQAFFGQDITALGVAGTQSRQGHDSSARLHPSARRYVVGRTGRARAGGDGTATATRAIDSLDATFDCEPLAYVRNPFASSTTTVCVASLRFDESVCVGEAALPAWMQDVLEVQWGGPVDVSCIQMVPPLQTATPVTDTAITKEVSVCAARNSLADAHEASSVWSAYPAQIEAVAAAFKRACPLLLPPWAVEEPCIFALAVLPINPELAAADVSTLESLLPPLVLRVNAITCRCVGQHACIITEATETKWISTVEPPLYHSQCLLPAVCSDTAAVGLPPFPLDGTGLDELFRRILLQFENIAGMHCTPAGGAANSNKSTEVIATRAMETLLHKQHSLSSIRTVVLTGPEGVGKSIVCSCISASLLSSYHSFNCIELIPGGSIRLTSNKEPSGSSGIPMSTFTCTLPIRGLVAAFAAARHYAPCLLVLYELDTHLRPSVLEQNETEEEVSAASHRLSPERLLQREFANLQQQQQQQTVHTHSSGVPHEADKKDADVDLDATAEVHSSDNGATATSASPVLVLATAESGRLSKRLVGCFNSHQQALPPTRAQRAVLLAAMLRQEFPCRCRFSVPPTVVHGDHRKPGDKDMDIYSKWAGVLAGLTPGYVAQNLRDVCLQAVLTAQVRAQDTSHAPPVTGAGVGAGADEVLCLGPDSEHKLSEVRDDDDDHIDTGVVVEEKVGDSPKNDDASLCTGLWVSLHDLVAARDYVLVSGATRSGAAVGSDLDGVSVTTGSDLSVEAALNMWEGIAGYADTKKQLDSIVHQWLHPEVLARLGSSPPSGLLLYGPPGSGKTLFASGLARHPGLNCITVRSSDVFSRYLGDSEKKIRAMFARARRLAPCILFFDDVDVIGRRRSGGAQAAAGSGVEDRVLATLLNEMDGIEENKGVYVVGATNRLEQVDAAMLRPGRLERLVELSLPTQDELKEMLQLHASNAVLAADIDWDALSALGGFGFTGADAKQWVKEAANAAMERVRHLSSDEQANVQLCQQDFLAALQSGKVGAMSTLA